MARTKHQETLMSLIQGPGMEVVVSHGVHTKNWVIPKALLSHHSGFFRVACDGPFEEGIENKITLHDCRPEVFEAFVHWLYFATLSHLKPEWDYIYGSFRLWILGDRLLVADFKNAAMRDLYDVHVVREQSVEPHEIEFIWKHTARGSALRRLVLDIVSLNWEKHCGMYAQSVWLGLFRQFPDFGDSLLLRLGTKDTELKIEKYLEEAKKVTLDELDTER
ncbi:unnamed protein product [Alternaria alternata]